MTWLQSIIYGIVSGLTEFLPISARSHQVLLMQLFGVDGGEPIRELLIHLSVLAALFIACRNTISKLHKDVKTAQSMRHSGIRSHELRGVYDLRLVKTACVPMLIGMLALIGTQSLVKSLPWVAGFTIINGLILFCSDRVRHGNKDARSMSALKSFCIGLSGFLSAFPGVSRVGAALSISSVCGADRRSALDWSLLLSIPALLFLCCFDVINIAQTGVAGVTGVILLNYFVSAVTAFAGGYLSVAVTRSFLSKTGLSGLSYYSWGIALILFVLYLIV